MLSLFLRCFLALLFLAAGFLHLRFPEIFRPVMPAWMPMQITCIYLSGLAELAGGAGLLLPPGPGRWGAALGLVLLLVLVFPVNLGMAVHGFRHLSPLLLWLRLPLQPVLIWAVWWFGSEPEKVARPLLRCQAERFML